MNIYFAAAANAQPFSSDEEIEIDDTITYGLLDKLKCKLCEEAFRPIVKEIKKDSSKVGDFLGISLLLSQY